MRPGMLTVDADGDWLLRVESRTVDILLDQLPWGISLGPAALDAPPDAGGVAVGR